MHRYAIVAAICSLTVILGACSQDGDAGEATGGLSAGEQAEVASLLADTELAARGQQLFGNCSVCHSLDAATPSPAGPHLDGIVGRNIGAIAEYPYTPVLTNSGGVWTVESLDAFLRNPQTALPGTAMAYAGLEDDADRRAVIAYLAAQGSGQE